MRVIRDRVRSPESDPAGWREALDDANLPEGYRSASVAAIAPGERLWIAAALESFPSLLGKGHGYYIHGNLNAGKSSLAAILLMDAVQRCERALWLPVRDVPMARFREGARGAWLDDRLARCDLLVLDDLGAERFRLSSAAGPALEEAVRIPYDRGRSIIITSNMPWETFISTSPYATDMPPLVSVIRRRVYPVAIRNTQWPVEPR